MQRWPQLTLRKGDALAQPRATAVNATNFKNYFDLLKKTLTTHHLLDCPNRIYNMDETGLPLDHKPSKVVALKGAKKVHCRTSGNKMQITILACANAGGTVIPPMVIFEGKRLNAEWTKGEVPCTLYGMSDKGWTDMELFSYWMKDLFLLPARYSAGADPPAECCLTVSHVMDVNDDAAQATTLIPAQLELFETRYENGYVCVCLITL